MIPFTLSSSPEVGSAGRTRPYPARTLLPMALRIVTLLGLLPASGAAQATRHWITETTVTFGRGGFAYQGAGSDAVVLGDLGLRWIRPSATGWGLSFAAGYDAPNEAALLGGRARASKQWDERRLEGFLAVLASSLGDGGVGTMAGLAFYPRPWGALVLQLDVMPTEPQLGCRAGDDCTEPRTLSGGSDVAVSYGVRLAERPALASWAAAGVVGLLAAAFAGELGCC